MTYPFTPVALVPVKIGERQFEMRWKIDLRPRFKPIPAQRCTVNPVDAAVAAAQAKLRADREARERRLYPSRFIDTGSLDWREKTKYGKRGTY